MAGYVTIHKQDKPCSTVDLIPPHFVNVLLIDFTGIICTVLTTFANTSSQNVIDN